MLPTFHFFAQRPAANMKLALSIALLFAAGSDAFHPGIGARSTSSLTLRAQPADCTQGDTRIECQLSESELQWANGNSASAKADMHKGDAQLILELEQAKERVRALEAELASMPKEAPEDDCVVDDPRIECTLSDLERKWMAGEDFVKGELQRSLELGKMKDEVLRLEKNLSAGLGKGWQKLNEAASP